MLRLQIAYPNDPDHPSDPGQVVQLPAGGPMEIDLIERCVQEIVSRGVGLFRTEAHVAADIRAGITAAIWNLKNETRHLCV